MSETDWTVADFAAAAGWSLERVEQLRGQHTRLRGLSSAQESFFSPEAVALLNELRAARQQLRVGASKKMLEVWLPQSERKLTESRNVRSRAPGPRAEALDRAIETAIADINDMRHALARS